MVADRERLFCVFIALQGVWLNIACASFEEWLEAVDASVAHIHAIRKG